MAGLLAAHALAGQPLNATTAVNYTRCGQFQKVRENTCVAANACGGAERFKDGPTASRAEAFALCDADPDCDAVQEYDGPAETNDWAEPCGAATCYKKCRRLCNKGGRTVLNDRSRRRLEEGCHFDNPSRHVYTCRPYVKEFGIRSPLAFWLCLMAAIFGGFLVALVGVKLGALLGYKLGPCTLLRWSLFSWFLGAFLVLVGFALWTAHFGQKTCTDGNMDAAIGIHSTAGALLVVALLGMHYWWRYRREARVDTVVPKKPPAQLRVRVTCPADGYAGKPITVRTPDGSEACASIPEGCAPGETFTILVRRSRWPGKWILVPAATPPNDYVPAHAAAGYYVGCSILPLPIVSCMSANGPDELRECCLIFPTPFGVYQEWRRDGQTNRFREVGGDGWWKDISAGSHNQGGCTILGAKLNCCTRGGTSSDVESGKAVPAVEETVSREVMRTVVPSVAKTEVPMATVGESEPSRAPPPLHEIVDALKQNLGLDGNFEEVVDAACLQLGVSPTGSLQEKADACWRAMEE
jgi:hypothetical protein